MTARRRASGALLLLLPLLLAACAPDKQPAAGPAQEPKPQLAAGGSLEEAPALPGPFAPRDECGELPRARPFLAALEAAVALRDPDLLAALAARDVRLGADARDVRSGADARDVRLGADARDGAEALRAALATQEAALWAELEALLALGCRANAQGGLTLPWFADQPTAFAAADSRVVVGEGVALRAMPDPAAAALEEVSFHEVGLVRDEQGQPVGATDGQGTHWSHVRLPAQGAQAQAQGFVPSHRLRAMAGIRLMAASRNGRWRIVSLASGSGG